MTPAQLQTLRALALAATQPGPWAARRELQGKGRHSYRVIDTNGFWVADFDDAPHDAAFVAAASPDVVLALLDECERLRRDRDSYANSGFERQLDDARQQLAAVSAARDEACDIADRVVEDNEVLHDRLEELRKVGAL